MQSSAKVYNKNALMKSLGPKSNVYNGFTGPL